MEDLRRLWVPQRETVANRAAVLMDAAWVRHRPNEPVSAWLKELRWLAGEVRVLRPAARRAICTVLDAVACDAAREQAQARQLRNQIVALDRSGVTAQLDFGAAAVPEALTAARWVRRHETRHLARGARLSRNPRSSALAAVALRVPAMVCR